MSNPRDDKAYLTSLRQQALLVLKSQNFTRMELKIHIAELQRAFDEKNDQETVNRKRQILLQELIKYDDEEVYIILMVLSKYWPKNEENHPQNNQIELTDGTRYNTSHALCNVKNNEPQNTFLHARDLAYIHFETKRRGIIDNNPIQQRYNVETTSPARINTFSSVIFAPVGAGLPLFFLGKSLITFAMAATAGQAALGTLLSAAGFIGVGLAGGFIGGLIGAGIGYGIYKCYQKYQQSILESSCKKVYGVFGKIVLNTPSIPDINPLPNSAVISHIPNTIPITKKLRKRKHSPTTERLYVQSRITTFIDEKTKANSNNGDNSVDMEKLSLVKAIRQARYNEKKRTDKEDRTKQVKEKLNVSQHKFFDKSKPKIHHKKTLAPSAITVNKPDRPLPSPRAHRTNNSANT